MTEVARHNEMFTTTAFCVVVVDMWQIRKEQ